ncbi:hypothetical protein [Cetobacterium sp.]
MGIRFIGDRVFTSIVIKGSRKLISGKNIDELFEKIGVELCK